LKGFGREMFYATKLVTYIIKLEENTILKFRSMYKLHTVPSGTFNGKEPFFYKIYKNMQFCAHMIFSIYTLLKQYLP
jgi:hypothetical protein